MNKKFVISVVVVFVALMVRGMLVHGMLLGDDYRKLTGSGLFRTEQASHAYMAYMILADVLIAIGITWIYRAGRDNRPWLGQGARFGFALSLVAVIPVYLIYFVVQPMPADLVVKQVLFDTIAMVLIGVIAAAVNRDPVPARV